jgi:hypothetical protein
LKIESEELEMEGKKSNHTLRIVTADAVTIISQLSISLTIFHKQVVHKNVCVHLIYAIIISEMDYSLIIVAVVTILNV